MNEGTETVMHRHDTTDSRAPSEGAGQAALRPWGWPTPPRPAGGLRVGTAERTAATDALCRHLADGRIDTPEFEERAARAAAATTQADLDALLADLPVLHPHGTGTIPSRRRRRRGLPLVGLAVIAAIAVTGLLGGAADAVSDAVTNLHVPWWLTVGAIVAVVHYGRGRHRRPR